MTRSRNPRPELPLDPDPGPLQPLLIASVALGGAVGTGARDALGHALPAGEGLPRGTLIANLVGCFVLGLVVEWLSRRGPDTGRRRQLRLLIGTGFCGGLTTYSSLAVESVLLHRSHHPGTAAVYVAVTIVGGLIAAGFGVVVASRIKPSS